MAKGRESTARSGHVYSRDAKTGQYVAKDSARKDKPFTIRIINEKDYKRGLERAATTLSERKGKK